MTQEHERLVERLRAKKPAWAYEADGSPAFDLINPDGPEAADAIERLSASLAAMEKREEEYREALRQIALETHETIPPDGKEAAFQTLGIIARIASTALTGDKHGNRNR